MEDELDLGRYAAALRRRIRLIVAVAAVGALVGLAVGVTSPMTMSGSLEAIDRSAELDAAGVDPDNIDVRPVMARIAARLNSDGFESRLDDDDTRVTAIAVVTGGSGSVAVAVSGASDEAVDQASGLVVNEASAMYADEMSDLIGGIGATFERSAQTAQSRLEVVEEQVAAAGPDQTTLTEGLLVQAEELRTEQAENLDQAAALERYEANLVGDLVLVGASTPVRSRSPLTMAIAGGLAGLVLAAGAVALRTAFDRRIRSRRDLDRLGLANLAGAVSADVTDSELDVLAGVLRQVAGRFESDLIQLVPVSGATQERLAAELTTRLDGTSVEARRPLDEDALATMSSAGTALNVLTVAWGRDDRDEVALASNRLAAASDIPIAVVLVGVPKRELDGIER